MRKILLVIVGLLLVTVGPAWGVTTTLTFDELTADTVVNGLNYMGIRYSYTVDGSPSGDAYYNGSSRTETLTYLSGGILEGDAHGTLTMDFATPTQQFSFGACTNTLETLIPGLTVTLYGTNGLIQAYPINTESLAKNVVYPFSEGFFTYTGTTAVSQAVFNFTTDPDPEHKLVQLFAMDNFTYDYNPVPLPPTVVLLGSGLLGLLGFARRKRS